MTAKDRLYNQLPAIYRSRDKKEDEPLRALMSVIETELETIEKDIDGLYNNWFIETCEDWVVPYIGDLLGAQNLHYVSSGKSLRAYVANTLAYRRRKGTPAVIEQLAQDVTGWHARVVEFFQLLAATQNMNHVRPACTTINLHDQDGINLLGGPFENASHIVDIRRMDGNYGMYNIPNIGIFLWKLQSYYVKRSTARKVDGTPDGKYEFYTFSPLGNDVPLFNQPQAEEEITHIAEEINIPGKLRRRALSMDLRRYRKAIEKGDEKPDTRYFGDKPVFTVFNGNTPFGPEFIMISDLSNWGPGWKPPESQEFMKFKRHDNTEYVLQVAVDPVLGRLVFLTGTPSSQLEVSYTYGFSGDIGGGPYEREIMSMMPEQGVWKKTVSGQDEKSDYDSLSEALIDWAKPEKGNKSNAIITITDNGTYEVNNNIIVIDLPAGRFLVIQADRGRRPAVRIMDNSFNASALNISGGSDARLILNGLLIEGGICFEGQSLELVRIVHCTLVPGWSLYEERQPKSSITIADKNYSLVMEIDHSIVGPLFLHPEIKALRVLDSIIDSPDEKEFVPPEIRPYAISDGNRGAGPSTIIDRSTVFGRVHVKELSDVSNVIFTEEVTVERRQQDCVRYSFVPNGSRTPRRYRCQPDLEITKRIEDEEKKAKAENRSPDISMCEAIKTGVTSWLVPAFTSKQYGNPGYGQLHASCPEQIKTGADDGSEMGAFHHLMQPQREANLRAVLDEYLRFGLKAGIFYVDEDKEVYKDKKVYEDKKEEL